MLWFYSVGTFSNERHWGYVNQQILCPSVLHGWQITGVDALERDMDSDPLVKAVAIACVAMLTFCNCFGMCNFQSWCTRLMLVIQKDSPFISACDYSVVLLLWNIFVSLSSTNFLAVPCLFHTSMNSLQGFAVPCSHSKVLPYNIVVSFWTWLHCLCWSWFVVMLTETLVSWFLYNDRLVSVEFSYLRRGACWKRPPECH